MLRIFNDEFFSFDLRTKFDNDSGAAYQLLNVLVEPRAFDLKQYKKSPFATFSTTLNIDKFKDGKGHLKTDYVPEYFLNTSFNQYSKYTSEDYDVILSKFGDTRAHTLIFDTTHPKYSEYYNHKVSTEDEREYAYLDKIILLIAIPIKGIVAPVKKSPNFKLYNGAFITCKLFTWNNDYYNKLVYYLVDMTTSFSFQEFVQTSNPELGVMHYYHFSLGFDKEIVMQKISSIIPCHNRESLFTKSERNLFFLSDIPSEIINRQASIAVPLSPNSR